MAYAPSAVAPRHIPQIKPRQGRGFFTRLFDAIEAANKRRAEEEIARFLGGPGCKFTDDSEREIERRFLSQP
jgi:hypothetical protein